MESMMVYAYRVVPAHSKKTARLERLLDNLIKQPLDKRVRLIAGTEIRLEDFKKRSDGSYLLDFVRFRFAHGPGRAHLQKPIAGFDFENDEGFGEETAALYDPASGHLLVQYNHFGVRAGRIAGFLSAIDGVPDNQYDLEIRFDESVEQKLARKKIIRSISFRAAAGKMSKADRDAGRSLTDVLQAGESFGGSEITFTISATKGVPSQGLNGNKVNQLIGWAKGRLGNDPESVKRLKVTGKEDPDTRAETLNLLGHTLKQEFDDLDLGKDLRVPRDQRWNALLRARNGWSRILK